MVLCEYPRPPARPASLLVRALDMSLAVGVDIHVQAHRMAADRAIFDVVLMRAGLDIHWHHDLFTTGAADVGRLGVR